MLHGRAHLYTLNFTGPSESINGNNLKSEVKKDQVLLQHILFGLERLYRIFNAETILQGIVQRYEEKDWTV